MTIDPERYKAFFEAHIEQGDTLESERLRIGVVTAIVAIWQYRFTVTGEQNHAGTTWMARRHDAGLALVRLCRDRQRFPEICGPRTVWTTGRITLEPGTHSIIPGRAESLFQFRDADPAVLDRLHAERFAWSPRRTARAAASSRSTRSRRATPADGRAADAGARRDGANVTRRQAHAHAERRRTRRAILARRLPAAMMFVPSIGGISHHWTENTWTRTSCSARRCSPTRSRMC